MKRIILVALLIALGVRLLVVRQCQKPTGAEVEHRVFLPIVMTGPKPALRGVGLTGPVVAVDQLAVAWYYTWFWQCPADRRFLPMIRGRPEMAHLREAVDCAKSGDGWLMGFNEPNNPEPYGNNIPPAEAAEMWRRIEEVAVGVKLLSPAPSQEDFGWLWRMVAEYKRLYGQKPRFDAIGVHWYNWQNPSEVQPAKDYLLRVRREALAHGYNVDVWLTEFAGHVNRADPSGGHQLLMRELIPWMRGQSWIARYAWFASLVKPVEPWCAGCQHCSLTYSDGSLTPLGELYRGY